jgi:hydroxyquinol 1,2-dioxygenase
VFLAGDPYLDSDVVFGVKESLIRELQRKPAGISEFGMETSAPYALLRYDFVLAPGVDSRMAGSD